MLAARAHRRRFSIPIERYRNAEAAQSLSSLVRPFLLRRLKSDPTVIDDLPEKIEVDLSALETIESVVTIADLNVDRTKVEIKNDPEQVVVKVDEPKVEEEPVVEETGEVVVAPAMNQKTPEEKAADDAKAAEEKKKDKE